MLVLTRRAGESIVIGDDVCVVVLDVRGDTVRLGIDAPRSVQVHRAEVYAEVQAANAAAVTGVDDLGPVAHRLRQMARPASSRSGPRSSRPDAAPSPGAPSEAPQVEPTPTPTPRPKPGPPPRKAPPPSP